jgi:hypothetical protein
MVEARINKAVVVYSNNMSTVLMATAEHGDEAMNIKVKYDWDTLDVEGFCSDLRESIAKGFECPVYHVDINKDRLLKKMELFNMNHVKAIH